ncbi:hypothetical protein Desaci_1205 [Desulfosporosinus acidiphilus SJ4]|uniref:Uncharacterized protein n=1 Tax=Desulfosporosinus acidiphilus (strain DSM 22704 / JCM 16185 / SJ4) TaxID=646529 RepID=I4D363_DESAJ|nr:hypothetical protein [Desulfosporosinus acidiphilus]AFM40237.1 hypothetical protein Desaci_1205 [Desulfosporosinus acidiphilus SJ4]
MADKEKSFINPNPGVCVPWELKLEEFGDLPGNEEIVKKEWEKLDDFAYNFIWFWVQR